MKRMNELIVIIRYPASRSQVTYYLNGYHPESVHADKIYLTRANHVYVIIAKVVDQSKY